MTDLRAKKIYEIIFNHPTISDYTKKDEIILICTDHKEHKDYESIIKKY